MLNDDLHQNTYGSKAFVSLVTSINIARFILFIHKRVYANYITLSKIPTYSFNICSLRLIFKLVMALEYHIQKSTLFTIIVMLNSSFLNKQIREINIDSTL